LDQGKTRAQVVLGFIYEGGTGVAADDTKAARWFAKAADQGDLIGETHLANVYYHGRAVPQDLAEAARWYRKLADLGDVFSQSILTGIYMDGRGGVGTSLNARSRASAPALRLALGGAPIGVRPSPRVARW
jgi:TPR repeat protein